MKPGVIILLILLPVFFSCSSGEITNDSLKISVTHTYVYSWLNMMPGSPPSFHITGNLRIMNYRDGSINDLSLNEIVITQDNNVIYKFKPAFETIHSFEDYSFKKNEVKEFRFSSSRLSIAQELNADKTIDAGLSFTSGGKTLEYMISDITIERTY
jgi:hypothetical protein